MSTDPRNAIDHPKRQRDKLRHGLYSPRLARGLSYADRQASIFRRHLEDLVVARDGGIDLYRAALVHSASEAQRLASANRTEKRQAADAGKLTPELSLAFDRDYLRALDARDRKLAELGLAKSAKEALIARLYNRKPATPHTGGPPA